MAINIPSDKQGNQKHSLDEIYAMIDEFIFGVQSGKYEILHDYDDIDDFAISLMEEYRLYTYKAPQSKITSYIDFTSKAHAMMNAGGMKSYVALLEQERKAVGNITNSFNTSTTHGKSSPILIGQNSTSEKKNFFQKILDDIRNAAVSHAVVAAITLVVSVAGTRLICRQPNQSASQQTQQSNTIGDSSNKSTDSLDKVKNIH